MSGVTVAVLAGADSRAAALAQQLSLPLITAPAEAPPDCLAWLQYRDGRLELQPVDTRQSGPVLVDFCGGANAHRRHGGAELVVQAVRGRSREPLSILDATAGLGRDAFVLAARGFQVQMLEREPVLAALLADGLARAAADAELAEIAARLQLMQGDAVAYCRALSAEQRPDVVYLDPMFPPSQKSALVKKEMRLLQQLLHAGERDTLSLLESARVAARLRVVVKRALRSPPLADRAPSYSVSGKAVRFDVYVN